MKRFKHGQRVLVVAVGDYVRIEITPTVGTVARLRRGDAGAWIALDRRVAEEFHAHPFPANDPGGRGTHVLAYPEDCEPEAADRGAEPAYRLPEGSLPTVDRLVREANAKLDVAQGAEPKPERDEARTERERWRMACNSKSSFDRITDLNQELAIAQRRVEELEAAGISENHSIATLTGNPRPGYTLQQEIRAQLEETNEALAACQAQAGGRISELEKTSALLMNALHFLAPDHPAIAAALSRPEAPACADPCCHPEDCTVCRPEARTPEAPEGCWCCADELGLCGCNFSRHFEDGRVRCMSHRRTQP